MSNAIVDWILTGLVWGFVLALLVRKRNPTDGKNMALGICVVMVCIAILHGVIIWSWRPVGLVLPGATALMLGFLLTRAILGLDNGVQAIVEPASSAKPENESTDSRVPDTDPKPRPGSGQAKS